jgi:hypothetical protein
MGQISKLVAFAKNRSNANKYEEVNLGNVSNIQAEHIAIATKVIVKGYIKIIPAHAINHIFKRHGNHQHQAKRNQVGIVDADFELLPDILTNPDLVTNGEENNKGNIAIKFIKKIGTIEYIVVMSIERKTFEKRLVLNTIYKKL